MWVDGEERHEGRRGETLGRAPPSSESRTDGHVLSRRHGQSPGSARPSGARRVLANSLLGHRQDTEVALQGASRETGSQQGEGREHFRAVRSLASNPVGAGRTDHRPWSFWRLITVSVC